MILGGIIAVEVHDATEPAANSPAVARQATLPLMKAASPAAGRTASWVSAILARPLFSRSRRPPPVAAAAAAARAVVPRLSGIMIGPAGKSAIFAPAGGKVIIAQEGDHVGMFTVRSISADRVTVAGPDGVNVLHIAFSTTKSSAAGATTPSAKPPFAGIAGITGTPGGIALDQGKPDLPSAATWAGPPALSRLPVAHPPPVSSPLLKSSSPAAGQQG